MIVVVLFFAIVWAAVLGHSFMRRRAENRSSDSIGAFRRHLTVLQRTGPVLVQPANSLSLVSAAGRGSVPPISTGYRSPEEVSSLRALDHDAFDGSPAHGSSYWTDETGVTTWSPRILHNQPADHLGLVPGLDPASPRPSPQHRQGTSAVLVRRRRILAGLSIGTLATAIIGVLPPLHPLWVITAFLAAALAAYMALLINLRNLAAERNATLHYLPYANAEHPSGDRYGDHAGIAVSGYGGVDRISALAHAGSRAGNDRSPLLEKRIAVSASGRR